MTTIYRLKQLLNKHSTWEKCVNSPDYDKICELDAMHNYEDYYQVKELKEKYKKNILCNVRNGWEIIERNEEVEKLTEELKEKEDLIKAYKGKVEDLAVAVVVERENYNNLLSVALTTSKKDLFDEVTKLRAHAACYRDMYGGD
tara:strand:- start:2606 stop:3037 length:432 start_codon:yes stop_codon:yes gene_type:complete